MPELSRRVPLLAGATAAAARARRIDTRIGEIAGFGSVELDTTSPCPPNTWHPLGGASRGTVCDRPAGCGGNSGCTCWRGPCFRIPPRRAPRR